MMKDTVPSYISRLQGIEPVDLESEKSQFKFKSCVWGPVSYTHLTLPTKG